MTDCVFCKIVEGKLPSYKVYEDEGYVAFLDKFPRTPGHVQIVPKKHYRWVYDVEDFTGYFSVVKKIADGVNVALNPRLVHIITIGDEVPHAHVWVVPRYDNDGHGSLIDIHKTIELSDEKMRDIAKRISSKLS